jgi:hypothetical protein
VAARVWTFTITDARSGVTLASPWPAVTMVGVGVAYTACDGCALADGPTETKVTVLSSASAKRRESMVMFTRREDR